MYVELVSPIISESRYTVSWCCVFLHASLTYSSHNMQISCSGVPRRQPHRRQA